LSCIFDELEETTVFVLQTLPLSLVHFVFGHHSVKDLLQLDGAVVMVVDDPREVQLARLLALHGLELARRVQMLGQVFAGHHDLALGVVLALYGHFGAVELLVIDVLSAQHAFVAQLTVKQHQLAVVAQVVDHPHPNHVLDAELADFDAVDALSPVVCHVSATYPSLASRIQAHDRLEAADFLVFRKSSVADLFGAPVAVVHALEVE